MADRDTTLKKVKAEFDKYVGIALTNSKMKKLKGRVVDILMEHPYVIWPLPEIKVTKIKGSKKYIVHIKYEGGN